MNRVQHLLGLSSPPIAVAFLDAPPEGVRKWEMGAAPAGCAFWRQAMKGETFYTVAGDHHNCAVGSYTHNIALPPERAKELEETVGFMVANHYLDMKEVPGIPVWSRPPQVVAYGPEGQTSFNADAVIVAAPPASAMLLYEAAIRAGAGGALANVLGRPGCAVLPLVEKTGALSLSFGCKGNRTFVGLPDSDIYVALPARHWAAIAKELEVVISANHAMGQYYQSKKSQFPILN